ncbi:replicative DNA helicase [Phaeobacter inhibens]|uniref:DnaB-like helicase C-terminal domain-containing protein n=1 Tax=Phaeobacter inhibens TaxID=221822 RepID=UPI002758BF83|nr:DnaB-like helicase C-terminal domain-containing protein [Phaeobacter inhibens]GLO70321.1 replicative DNA helicase [Phaeobacter inhibens]
MNQQNNEISAVQSIEGEQQLLGALLANNDRFHEISGITKQEHFADPVHADIWQNFAGRMEGDHIVTPTTLAADMVYHDGFAELGGAAYLRSLMGASVGGFAVKEYAFMLSEMHQRRTMACRFDELSGDLRSGRSANDVASEVELLLMDRAETSADPRTMSFSKAQMRSIDQLHEIKKGNLIGVPTGLRALDDKVTLAPKRYTILGGQTSMGKTALALHIAHSAAKEGYGVGFVTLEMPEEDLCNRINSIESGLNYDTYDKPMSQASFDKVVEAAVKLQGLPLEIFSGRVRDVPAVLSEGKKLKHKWQPEGKFRGFKLLIIDYIQLMRGREKTSFERLSQIANDLKNVAKQLDVHVLALAQVDRTLGKLEKWDKWSDARPSLAHLRGSGDLENAPDNVLFVFRPQYFLTPPRCTPPKDPSDRADWEEEYAQWKDMAEIIIGKARMGEIGSVKVACDMGTNRFWDLDDGQERMF